MSAPKVHYWLHNPKIHYFDRGPRIWSLDDIEERLLENLVVDSKTNCWEWCGTRNNKRYGVLVLTMAKYLLAHRVAAWLFIPDFEITSKLFVCHKCDNPPCCNPDHLFIGTNSDNIRDCVKKGRFTRPRGEKHYEAKLNQFQVRRIRLLNQIKGSERFIARLFGVSRGAVRCILNGRTWAHLN